MKMPKKDAEKAKRLDPEDPRVEEFIARAQTVTSGADVAPRRPAKSRRQRGKRAYEPKGGYVRATYDIPEELHEAIRRAAFERGREWTMRDLVVEWVEKGLKEEKGRKASK